MFKIFSKQFPCCLLLFILISSSAPAYAYLDPGTISLTLQAVFAAVAGIALLWRQWFWRLLQFLGIKKGKNQEDDCPEEDKIDSEDR